jgi:predicted transcriptional regulator
MNGSESRDRPVDRLSVPEAAELLGVTQSAVRKRVQRGTIPWDKDSEGRIYVYVDLSETSHETGRDKARDAITGQSRDELLEAYRDQIDFLRRELERKDTLLMSLMQRVPELEPAPEPREAAAAPPDGTTKGDSSTEPPEPAQRRSWLSRFFFGPE